MRNRDKARRKSPTYSRQYALTDFAAEQLPLGAELEEDSNKATDFE